MTLLAREFAPRLAQELARQQRDVRPLSVLLVAVPATDLALAALRGSLRGVDAVAAAAPQLLAALLPATDAAAAGIVAGRARELFAPAGVAALTFPPYAAPPLADELYADLAAGGTAWCAGALADATTALHGYAARYVAALPLAPRPRRLGGAVGPRELLAYLDYEVRRSRRYGLSFAVGFCAPALADGFDRVLRLVASDTALGDVFGILEGGCLFVFSYHSVAADARLLDGALRRHFQLAADDPAVRVLAFPADASSPEDIVALLDPVTGSLMEK